MTTPRAPATEPASCASDELAPHGIVLHAVPAWGGSVMGTGIVGIAAHTLPVQVVGMTALARVSWLLACGLLVFVVSIDLLQAVRHPQVARAHLLDPRTAPATGTVAMAFLTVGTATLLVAEPVLGLDVARAVDVVLYGVGTLLGLATAVGVPLMLVLRREHGGPTDAASVWMLPVVPPMVSAAAGGILAQHLGVGTTRSTLVVVSLMLFGLSLLAALLVLSLLWARLLLHGLEGQVATPTLWVVLGPLGQGATALGAIALAAQGTLPAPYPAGLAVVALVGGAALLGFAALWAAMSSVLTGRALAKGLGFHLGWWSFTFPVGTCVTGLSSLATRTHLPLFEVLAVATFVVLLAAWSVVAVRTVLGARTFLSPLAG